MTYIYDAIQELIAEYETRDPLEILAAMNVQIVECNCQPQANPSFYGMVTAPDGDPDYLAVIINPHLDREDTLLTYAHELTHIAVDMEAIISSPHRDCTIYNPNDRTEYRANTGAAHLLIDDDEFIRLMEEGYDAFSIARILHVKPALLGYKVLDFNRMGYDLPTGWITNRLFG